MESPHFDEVHSAFSPFFSLNFLRNKQIIWHATPFHKWVFKWFALGHCKQASLSVLVLVFFQLFGMKSHFIQLISHSCITSMNSYFCLFVFLCFVFAFFCFPDILIWVFCHSMLSIYLLQILYKASYNPFHCLSRHLACWGPCFLSVSQV